MLRIHRCDFNYRTFTLWGVDHWGERNFVACDKRRIASCSWLRFPLLWDYGCYRSITATREGEVPGNCAAGACNRNKLDFSIRRRALPLGARTFRTDWRPLTNGDCCCLLYSPCAPRSCQGERNFHILYELVAGGAKGGLSRKLKVMVGRRGGGGGSVFICLERYERLPRGLVVLVDLLGLAGLKAARRQRGMGVALHLLSRRVEESLSWNLEGRTEHKANRTRH